MTTSKTFPASGYAILKVYTSAQSLEVKDIDTLPIGTLDVKFGWDWRYVAADTFEVKVSIVLEPEKSRPFSASTTVVGVFRRVGDSHKVTLRNFVGLQAVAILLPYARQYIANLTVNTMTGAFNLPTVNVVALMADFDPEKTTGAHQEKDGQIPDGSVKAAPKALKKEQRKKLSPLKKGR